MTQARRPIERTPTPCRIRVHEEGRNSRHQARESERTFGMKRGCDVRLLTERPPVSILRVAPSGL
jgi:hypothetical protein